MSLPELFEEVHFNFNFYICSYSDRVFFLSCWAWWIRILPREQTYFKTLEQLRITSSLLSPPCCYLIFIPVSLLCCEIFIDSQNHRMVGFGRDLCGSSSPTLLPKQGHLQ